MITYLRFKYKKCQCGLKKFQKGLKKNRAHNKECLFLATSANKQYLAQKSCLLYN